MTTINAVAVKRSRQHRGLSPENMAAEIGVPLAGLLTLESEGHQDGGPLEESAETVRLYFAYFGADVRTGPTS